MRTAALALMTALLLGCPSDDPGVGASTGMTPMTRAERCEAMYLCGVVECAAEIQAINECNSDNSGPEACSMDDARRTELFTERDLCFEAQGCNFTDCTMPVDDHIEDCGSEVEGEVYSAAVAEMHRATGRCSELLG